MPHIIKDSFPPMLTSEQGYSSILPLGADVLAYSDRPEPELEHHVHRLRQAVQRLCYSDDPDVQIVRRSMDSRFLFDTAGAPADFAYGRSQSRSITMELAGLSDVDVYQFAFWNRLRQLQVRKAIIENMPDLCDDVIDRARLLHDSGIIPRYGFNQYKRTIEDVAERDNIFALDSFEGASTLGMTAAKKMYLSQLFDGGYRIGDPLPEFFEIAFHEAGHIMRADFFYRLALLQPVEEALDEHHTAISGGDGQYIHENMFEASSRGVYQSLRKLFGMALLESDIVDAEFLGTTLVKSNSDIAYKGLCRALRAGFDRLLPNQDGDAFKRFLLSYNEMSFGHQAEELTIMWASEMERNLFGERTAV